MSFAVEMGLAVVAFVTCLLAATFAAVMVLYAAVDDHLELLWWSIPLFFVAMFGAGYSLAKGVDLD